MKIKPVARIRRVQSGDVVVLMSDGSTATAAVLLRRGADDPRQQKALAALPLVSMPAPVGSLE